MSTSPAWSLAWNWTSEWRTTTSFWVSEVLSGGVAFAAVWLTTSSLAWAGLAIPLGAVLTFLAGLIGRAGAIWLERRRALHNALVKLAEVDLPERIVVEEPQQNKGPSQRVQNIERFARYVDKQLDKLQNEWKRQASSVRPNWSGLENLAQRTAEGIGRFDATLSSYIINSFTDEWGNALIGGRNDAERVIEAVQEAMDLYDGEDPSKGAPF